MAKIRGIKPEFWTDEAIVELSPMARLLFIGMWNFACDNGHLADKPRQIKMRILPADDGVDVSQLLDELDAQGRIERAAGTITIHRFAHHQKPHKHWWTTCDLPGCERPDGSSQPEPNSGATVEQPLATSRSTADVEVDCDVDVDVDVEGDGEKPTTAPRKRGARIPDGFSPDDAMREWAAEHTPGMDVDAATAEFVDYWRAVPGAKGTKLDWTATWRNRMREVHGRRRHLRTVVDEPAPSFWDRKVQPR